LIYYITEFSISYWSLWRSEEQH